LRVQITLTLTRPPAIQATGHPVIASAQPHERWLWCYVDQEWKE